MSVHSSPGSGLGIRIVVSAQWNSFDLENLQCRCGEARCRASTSIELVVEFTTLNQDKVIQCAISTAAMDDLEGKRDVWAAASGIPTAATRWCRSGISPALTLREYHEAIGRIVIKYGGTLERFAGDGVMVIFNDPVPVENPALQAVLMALEMRDAIGALTETWHRWGHDIGFGIGIAHGFATLGTIGFEGRFDYAAIGTVSNVASRLCDEAKPGQILISPRVLTKVEKSVTVEPVGEFALKGIRRPMMTYNVLGCVNSNLNWCPLL
jgi:hypothetical protein